VVLTACRLLQKYIEIDDAHMDKYRNMGGFDIIGSGRDKIESVSSCQWMGSCYQ